MFRITFLVRCSFDEAETMRAWALVEHRTLGAHILNVMLRALAIEDRLLNRCNPGEATSGLVKKPSSITRSAERTAILVRCERFELEQIRNAAERRNMSVNAFVLFTLRQAWYEQSHAPLAIASSPNAFRPEPKQA